MTIYKLDFTGCRYWDDIHNAVKETFGFPDYYGKNLDAMWDCLDYYCDFRLHVLIYGLNTIPKEYEEYMGKC